MSNKMSNKKRAAIIAVATVGLLGSGVALASWTASGTGNGSATAEKAKALTVTLSDVGGLYPTGSVSVPFTVTNPNPYAVQLSTVQLQSVKADAAGCNVDSVTGADLPDDDVIPAGQTTASRNFTLSMSNGANDACQGARFTVTLSVSGASH